MSVHANSMLAFKETQAERGSLESRIMELMADGQARTDRQIATALEHPEPLRPRITTLLAEEQLHEVGSATCEHTGKRVRLTKIFLRS